MCVYVCVCIYIYICIHILTYNCISYVIYNYTHTYLSLIWAADVQREKDALPQRRRR